MRLADSVTIRAPRQRVWEFLLDPQRVAGCFPQVDRLERLGPTRVRASVPVRVAFMTLRVVIDVDLAEQAAPERAKFRIHATGPGSSADGLVSFTLRDAPPDAAASADPAGTLVEWTADVQPAGMAASVGPETIERQARPALERAIDCLRRSVETA
ncbi:MAG TPA: SRPBCC domain-containing protein [Candidatus Dormibacteraeota bacterium]|nr:SRPBCC domain-containing protein [Candidatus Dormibacteraeota bacterium]